VPEGTDSDVVEAMSVNVQREQAELEGDAKIEDAEFDEGKSDQDYDPDYAIEANKNDVMDDMRNMQ